MASSNSTKPFQVRSAQDGHLWADRPQRSEAAAIGWNLGHSSDVRVFKQKQISKHESSYHTHETTFSNKTMKVQLNSRDAENTTVDGRVRPHGVVNSMATFVTNTKDTAVGVAVSTAVCTVLCEYIGEALGTSLGSAVGTAVGTAITLAVTSSGTMSAIGTAVVGGTLVVMGTTLGKTASVLIGTTVVQAALKAGVTALLNIISSMKGG